MRKFFTFQDPNMNAKEKVFYPWYVSLWILLFFLGLGCPTLQSPLYFISLIIIFLISEVIFESFYNKKQKLMKNKKIYFLNLYGKKLKIGKIRIKYLGFRLLFIFFILFFFQCGLGLENNQYVIYFLILIFLGFFSYFHQRDLDKEKQDIEVERRKIIERTKKSYEKWVK